MSEHWKHLQKVESWLFNCSILVWSRGRASSPTLSLSACVTLWVSGFIQKGGRTRAAHKTSEDIWWFNSQCHRNEDSGILGDKGYSVAPTISRARARRSLPATFNLRDICLGSTYMLTLSLTYGVQEPFGRSCKPLMAGSEYEPYLHQGRPCRLSQGSAYFLDKECQGEQRAL